MYDKYEKNVSFASWMIAGGARLDEPDPRELAHRVALRDAKRDAKSNAKNNANGSGSPFARLTGLFGRNAASAPATIASSATTCCTPA